MVEGLKVEAPVPTWCGHEGELDSWHGPRKFISEEFIELALLKAKPCWVETMKNWVFLFSPPNLGEPKILLPKSNEITVVVFSLRGSSPPGSLLPQATEENIGLQQYKHYRKELGFFLVIYCILFVSLSSLSFLRCSSGAPFCFSSCTGSVFIFF